MDQKKIDSAIDSAFEESFAMWEKQMAKGLFPGMLDDEYGWKRIKSVIILNNNYLKLFLKKTLTELLADK